MARRIERGGRERFVTSILDIEERNSRGLFGSRVESMLPTRGDWRKTKIRKILRVHRSPNGYRLVARPIYEAGIVVFIGQSVNSSLYYAARYTCTPNESRPVPLNKIFLPAIGRYIGCISPVTNCLPIGQVCLARYNRSSIRQTFPLSPFLFVFLFLPLFSPSPDRQRINRIDSRRLIFTNISRSIFFLSGPFS